MFSNCKKLSMALLIMLLPLAYTKYLTHDNSNNNYVLRDVSSNVIPKEELSDEMLLSAQMPVEFLDNLQANEGSGDFWDLKAIDRKPRNAKTIADDIFDAQLKQIFNTEINGIFDNINKESADVANRQIKERSVSNKKWPLGVPNNNVTDTGVKIDSRFSILEVPPSCQEGYIAVHGRCRKLV